MAYSMGILVRNLNGNGKQWLINLKKTIKRSQK
jgi:hypothetical protein